MFRNSEYPGETTGKSDNVTSESASADSYALKPGPSGPNMSSWLGEPSSGLSMVLAVRFAIPSVAGTITWVKQGLERYAPNIDVLYSVVSVSQVGPSVGVEDEREGHIRHSCQLNRLRAFVDERGGRSQVDCPD